MNVVMKNADMPAMPLSGDAYQDFAGYDGTKNTSYNPECQGLTKREYAKVHAPPMPDWFAYHHHLVPRDKPLYGLHYAEAYEAWLNYFASLAVDE